MITEQQAAWAAKTEQLCKYCGNYSPQRMTEGAPARGECREKPPVIVTLGNDIGHFPLVWAKCWCGSFWKAPECRHQLMPFKCPLDRPRWADGDTNYAHTCNTCGLSVTLKGEIV